MCLIKNEFARLQLLNRIINWSGEIPIFKWESQEINFNFEDSKNELVSGLNHDILIFD